MTRRTSTRPKEIVVRLGANVFRAQLEWDRAPLTTDAFVKRLPWQGQLVQARWSGEALWMPLGATTLFDRFENATSYPSPGQVLWHPADMSEAELLVPYGPTRFASKAGQLAGNHFLTIEADPVELAEIGRMALWHGALEVSFELPSGGRA